MAKKTVQLAVNFFAEVDENVNPENLCIDVNVKNIKILDGTLELKNVKVHEYETIMVDTIA